MQHHAPEKPLLKIHQNICQTGMCTEKMCCSTGVRESLADRVLLWFKTLTAALTFALVQLCNKLHTWFSLEKNTTLEIGLLACGHQSKCTLCCYCVQKSLWYWLASFKTGCHSFNNIELLIAAPSGTSFERKLSAILSTTHLSSLLARAIVLVGLLRRNTRRIVGMRIKPPIFIW